MNINLTEPEVEAFLKADDIKAAESFYTLHNIPLNYTTEDGWSLLALAALNECPHILEFLVEKQNFQIDFNATTENPLWIALEENNASIAKYLLTRLTTTLGQENSLALPETLDSKKAQDILAKALKTENASVAQTAVDFLSTHFSEFPEFTQLLKIFQSALPAEEKDKILTPLIENKVSVGEKDKISNDVYDIGSLAVQYNCPNTLSWLIEHEYVFSQFGEFDTLMQIAMDNKAFGAVALLLNSGLTLTKDQTLTCIDYVAQNQDTPSMFVLLDLLRADPFFSTVANQNGDNNLFLSAIKNKNEELINWCLDKGINLTRVDANQNNAVILCAETGNIELLKKLKEKGVALDARDRVGNNALMIAAGNQDLDFVEELLRDKVAHLVGVNAQNNNGVDAVSLAITRKDFDLLDILLLSAPHLTFKNLNDAGPSDFIEHDDFDLTSEVLDSDTFKLDSLQALAHLGYDFNLKNGKGENLARIYAQHNASLANLNLLLSVGADVEERGEDKLDALEYCVKAGYYEKLNVILHQRNYDFSSEEKQKDFMSLLNASPYRQKTYEVLFSKNSFINSSLFERALMNAVDKSLDLEEYTNFSTLHRTGLIEENFLHKLIKKSIQMESAEGFFALIGYIEKNMVPELEEKIKTVYAASSKEFKKDTQDIYNHFFAQGASPKFYKKMQ